MVVVVRERRLFRRIPMEADVAFQELSFGKEAQKIQTKYKDVSGGGLLLSSPLQCPLGTLLRLEIKVPGLNKFQNLHFEKTSQFDQRPLAAIGQVVRVEAIDDGGFELGVKFLNVYPDDLKALLALINSSDQVLQT